MISALWQLLINATRMKRNKIPGDILPSFKVLLQNFFEHIRSHLWISDTYQHIFISKINKLLKSEHRRPNEIKIKDALQIKTFHAQLVFSDVFINFRINISEYVPKLWLEIFSASYYKNRNWKTCLNLLLEVNNNIRKHRRQTNKISSSNRDASVCSFDIYKKRLNHSRQSFSSEEYPRDGSRFVTGTLETNLGRFF